MRYRRSDGTFTSASLKGQWKKCSQEERQNKLEALLRSGKPTRFTSDTVTDSWRILSEEDKELRLSGIAKYNTEKSRRRDERLAELGWTGLCKCGCAQNVKKGRFYVTGHNAKGNTRVFSEAGRKVLQDNGRRTSEENMRLGRHIGPASQLGKPQTREHRSKNSEGVKRAIANGFNVYKNLPGVITRELNGVHAKGTYWSERFQRKIWYDSGWELKRIKFIETCPEVKDFGRAYILIPYFDETKRKRFYHPDFRVEYHDGRTVIEEVKPYKLLPLGLNPLKIAALKAYCDQHGFTCRIVSNKFELDATI